MLEQFKKDLKAQNGGLLGILVFLPLIFLMGVGMVFLIMNTDDTANSWFCMGTLMTLIMLMVFQIFLGLAYHQEFMLALSMGRTRKEFMVSYALRTVLLLVCAYLAILLFYGLEQTLYKLSFPRFGNEVSFDFLYNIPLVVGVILVLAALNMFVGAMYSRFGKKFLPALYLVWMALCILGPKAIPDEDHTGAVADFMRSLVNWAASMGSLFWIILGICAAAAMVGSTIHLGRKEMVH